MSERQIEYTPLSKITPFDRNPKGHDDEKLRESIERFGFTNAMLLCERRKELAEGHGRLGVLQAMQAEGKPPPEGILQYEGNPEWLAPLQRGWASKDDQEFEAYVVAANRLVISGGWDENIAEYLGNIEDLTGTGFEHDDIGELKRLLAGSEGALKPDDEWVGMPEFEQDDRKGIFHVIVHFASDTDADAFFALLDKPKKSQMWWPEHDGLKGSSLHHEYVAEGESADTPA